MLITVTLVGGYNLSVAAGKEEQNKLHSQVSFEFYPLNSVLKEDYCSSKSFVYLAIFCTAYCV